MLNWARLVRLPNVPTAAADALAGYWIARVPLASGAALSVDWTGFDLYCLGAAIASCSLYMAGMIWNDWFDVEIDRRERPQRPLPSGAISPKHAAAAATALTIAGICGAGALGPVSGGFGAALAVAILAYDGGLKNRPAAGPVCMGCCRGLNFGLGFAAGWESFSGRGMAAFPGMQATAGMAVLALAHAAYTAGVTWFARTETTGSSARRLSFAAAVLFGALLVRLAGLLWLLRLVDPRGFHSTEQVADPERVFGSIVVIGSILLAGWLGIWVCPALRRPAPALVQRAVKWSILSMVLLQAHAALSLGLTWQAAVIASLIVPCIVLGRWLYST